MGKETFFRPKILRFCFSDSGNVSTQKPGTKYPAAIQLTTLPSPRITQFPLVRFPLTKILAYVRTSGGIPH